MDHSAGRVDSLSRTRERVRVRARALRQSSPDAERRLWERLRDRRLAGYKFRRQVPIGKFFADFACIDARLIVELDGSQHFEPKAVEFDTARTDALNGHGFQVMRFDDRQALNETDAVLAVIHDWLTTNHPHPNPLPRAGEGVNTPPFPCAGEGAHTLSLPCAGAGFHTTLLLRVGED